MRKITEIIVHCSATPEGRNVTIDDIDRWHRQRGWEGVGYHYVIHLDGSIHKGRDLERVGAHCIGHNKQSIGICYIGGLDVNGKPKDTRTPEQKDSLSTLINQIRLKYPNVKVFGHRDFANKDCPCFSVHKEYLS